MAPINNTKMSAGRKNSSKSYSMLKNSKEKKMGSSNTHTLQKSGLSRTPSKKANVMAATNVKPTGRSSDVKIGKTNNTPVGKNISTNKTSVVSYVKPQSSKLTSTLYSPTRITPNSSKVKFGLIWIPLRKRNKHKDAVYDSHRYEERRIERTPSMYNTISEDFEIGKQEKDKKEENVLDKSKTTVAAGAIAVSDASTESAHLEDSNDHSLEFKEIGIESNDIENISLLGDNKSYSLKHNSDDANWCKAKMDDNVDSVALRLPPANKNQSETSPEEEECGIKCLYYTLQCCDCVIT